MKGRGRRLSGWIASPWSTQPDRRVAADDGDPKQRTHAQFGGHLRQDEPCRLCLGWKV